MEAEMNSETLKRAIEVLKNPVGYPIKEVVESMVLIQVCAMECAEGRAI